MALPLTGCRRPILLGLTGIAALAHSACHKHEDMDRAATGKRPKDPKNQEQMGQFGFQRKPCVAERESAYFIGLNCFKSCI